MSKTKKSPRYRFFNRELSWLEFNRRVLSEGLDSSVPLLERMKFLAITSSNFDEFFMVRVATLKRAVRHGDMINCPSGLRPSEQLEEIDRRVRSIVNEQYECLKGKLIPSLRKVGVDYAPPEKWNQQQLRAITALFNEEIFPVISPVRITEEEPFPFICGLRLHILFALRRPENAEEEFALVQIPEAQQRVIFIPDPGTNKTFTLLDDIILYMAENLFPGYGVTEAAIFRVTRDADMGVDEQRDEDFVEAMEEIIQSRRTSRVVRLEINTPSDKLKCLIIEKLEIDEKDIYSIDGPVDLKSLMNLALSQSDKKLHDPEWQSYRPVEIDEDENLWDALKERDILLHHPYESFDVLVQLLQLASQDPGVLAIKMTLYRTSGSSPIVRALKEAAANGKHVTAVVELKARFDEERNIRWAEELERSGVIVVYGIAHLKIHAKALMIVRREEDRIRRYVHLGTGNYNDSTAKFYTDMGLLTSNEEISQDIALVFNAITGYSNIPELRQLAMAPVTLKRRILNLIERESSRSSKDSPGYICAKMNSLADSDVIKALYMASQAGVRIDLNVRGICMLVPGVKGLSENITVVSIIDRYLEHTRLFFFQNGGNDEYYLSSADWMPRNLERRVELMFPVIQEYHKRRLSEILSIYFNSNIKSHELMPDGTYRRLEPEPGEEPLRAQEEFHRLAYRKADLIPVSPRREFTVRRKPPKVD
ncbi:polyphosphate kinase 1 [Marispirochaeta sp.]|uniref:polyphosphate kinase 1 n=1 Tax=Marispirochaeta sp. TaxID=2038653 RepID=UPI0029C97E37|nr:polyphosphate kinase 1 [Marispirochaeta sp.]